MQKKTFKTMPWTQDDLDKYGHWLDDDEYDHIQYMVATDEEKAVIDKIEKEAAKTGLALLGGVAGMVPKSTEITSE